MTLQARAKAFLNRSIPGDLDYALDSFSERFIKSYAEDGKVDLDPEAGELLQMCAMEASSAAEEGSPDRRAYFRESAAILEAILAEAEG